ncbi:MAG: OB-fold domain-containing protein [Candidatus Andersenbacteria bacterium]|nr:OB-fold domain-containing protein [Candidatus Andersenbacteria bacterium]
MNPHVFEPRGTVLYTTTVVTPPPGFEERTPYVIGLIELEEGGRLLAHIVDSGTEIESGVRVEGVVRRLYDRNDGGPLHYAMAFRVTTRS